MEEVSCLQPTLGGRDNLAPRWMELLFLLEVRGNPAEISSLSQPGLAKASFSRGAEPSGRGPSSPSKEGDWNQSSKRET